jgi:hypothetical protein
MGNVGLLIFSFAALLSFTEAEVRCMDGPGVMKQSILILFLHLDIQKIYAKFSMNCK